MATAIYYFDGHTGISDPNTAWSNDSLAFDGIADDSGTGTYSAAYGSGSGLSTKTLRYLQGKGTTAPTSGAPITQVRLRITAARYFATTYAMSGTAYTADLSEELGTATANNGNPLVTGSWVTLTPPTGDWTWEHLAELTIRFWGGSYYDEPSAAGRASLAEIEVTYTPSVNKTGFFRLMV